MGSGDPFLIPLIVMVALAGIVLWRIFRRPIDRGPDPTPRDTQSHSDVMPGVNPMGDVTRRR